MPKCEYFEKCENPLKSRLKNVGNRQNDKDSIWWKHLSACHVYYIIFVTKW
uniref:Uncharacterized protein n=1 Tax=Siphoviridae sp. cteEQ43 TaxID=2827905 RepID=A0A8S5TD15_9CAUD|nr:MAG TPA: hypothetical protein [Siphoviridae sp. cteEQ43]